MRSLRKWRKQQGQRQFLLSSFFLSTYIILLWIQIFLSMVQYSTLACISNNESIVVKCIFRYDLRQNLQAVSLQLSRRLSAIITRQVDSHMMNTAPNRERKRFDLSALSKVLMSRWEPGIREKTQTPSATLFQSIFVSLLAVCEQKLKNTFFRYESITMVDLIRQIKNILAQIRKDSLKHFHKNKYSRSLFRSFVSKEQRNSLAFERELFSRLEELAGCFWTIKIEMFYWLKMVNIMLILMEEDDADNLQYEHVLQQHSLYMNVAYCLCKEIFDKYVSILKLFPMMEKSMWTTRNKYKFTLFQRCLNCFLTKLPYIKYLMSFYLKIHFLHGQLSSNYMIFAAELQRMISINDNILWKEKGSEKIEIYIDMLSKFERSYFIFKGYYYNIFAKIMHRTFRYR